MRRASMGMLLYSATSGRYSGVSSMLGRSPVRRPMSSAIASASARLPASWSSTR
ncbi:Uncharacterised protein [Bordetella pertussis]|nr:Uncharacterised protein [Bordetella pertussis]CPP67282.1 Uncharacterised protein [Bordetella pertussis]